MSVVSSMLHRRASYLEILLIWNIGSLLLSSVPYFYLHTQPPIIPDAIRFAAKDLSRDQIVDQLIEAYRAVDAAESINTFLLPFWSASAGVSVAILLYGYWRNKVAKP
jgi:hypothetical protein